MNSNLETFRFIRGDGERERERNLGRTWRAKKVQIAWRDRRAESWELFVQRQAFPTCSVSFFPPRHCCSRNCDWKMKLLVMLEYVSVSIPRHLIIIIITITTSRYLVISRHWRHGRWIGEESTLKKRKWKLGTLGGTEHLLLKWWARVSIGRRWSERVTKTTTTTTTTLSLPHPPVAFSHSVHRASNEWPFKPVARRYLNLVTFSLHSVCHCLPSYLLLFALFLHSTVG